MLDSLVDYAEVAKAGRYLGPAMVLRIDGPRIVLGLPGGEAEATMALAYPYHPEPGDLVLAIGERDLYVIGVLQGRGKTNLDVAGDLRIRARGRITIESGERVALSAPRLTLVAGRVETAARAIVERCSTCSRRVQGLYRVLADRWRTVVRGTATHRAERIAHRARKDVKIDGDSIRLG